jgi:RNA polymerase sigma-70 factor (ECF subfamily)
MEMQDRVVELIPRLRRYARALLKGDAYAADDLVDDCLERALSRWNYWQKGSNLRAWLFTIMHNIYANQVRRAVNGPQFVELPEDNSSGSAPCRIESPLILGDLQRALDQLPPEQREILLLVGLEGLRYQEVASILDLPMGTVMSRLSRARKQLRGILSHGQGPSLRRVK